MASKGLFGSSLVKKYWMALTGLFLISFLVVHVTLNSFIFFNDGGVTFNMGAEFMAKNPKAVVALMMAIHRATLITNKMTPDQVIDLASQDWFSDRAAQRPYVENILYRRRGWSWKYFCSSPPNR